MTRARSGQPAVPAVSGSLDACKAMQCTRKAAGCRHCICIRNLRHHHDTAEIQIRTSVLSASHWAFAAFDICATCAPCSRQRGSYTAAGTHALQRRRGERSPRQATGSICPQMIHSVALISCAARHRSQPFPQRPRQPPHCRRRVAAPLQQHMQSTAALRGLPPGLRIRYGSSCCGGGCWGRYKRVLRGYWRSASGRLFTRPAGFHAHTLHRDPAGEARRRLWQRLMHHS